MFDNFDYKRALKGAGGLVGGAVKAYRPESKEGVDQAGGGLGEILKAAGVELGGDEPPEKPAKPAPSKARELDGFDLRPRAKRAQPAEPAPQAEPGERAAQAEPQSDREVTAELLLQRGWSQAEVDKILAGPASQEAQPAERVSESKAARVQAAEGQTAERVAISNAAAPAKRVPMAKAKRVK